MPELINKIMQIDCNDKRLRNTIKLFNIFINIRKENNPEYVKVFINTFYDIKESMPKEFYELFLARIKSDDYLSLFNILLKRNIFTLISYLKFNQELIEDLEEEITPQEYYTIPKRYINNIVTMLKKLKIPNKEDSLSLEIKDEAIWLLKRNPHFKESEYILLAYKMYISIGLDNSLELLSNKYGEIDYEKVHYLFSKLNTKKRLGTIEQQAFNNFLFENKKDSSNITKQMLNGEFKELFLNFDYFYNNIYFFINKLSTKMSKNEVKSLLEERYIARDVRAPEITGDILEDMISSYYCKYDSLNTSEIEIEKKNFKIYNDFLQKKYKSSIPMIEFKKEAYICEVISLSDPRNLVLGYRAGNCFRINGEASVLFSNFIKSSHMRLLSISTLEHKDFAMMLIMRNGNVLIGQGIEVSKRAPSNIKGKELYDTCKEVLKELMEYMNSRGDEIVATIIGNTNSHVSLYNNQTLPFLIHPILENSNNYYNGIYNYQCLLDISEGKSLEDIRLYIPEVIYYDKREPILRRKKNSYDNYMEIEKRLMTLRYYRSQKEKSFHFYLTLTNRKEIYTTCNKDWYITLFDDGTIDSFILEYDERAKEEYDGELIKIQQLILKNNLKKTRIKNKFTFNCKHTINI
ncbi:MAG: hypothetical protein E7163_04505 [Firmicutes bacterium]|nr:hypothetical protein [Bacillota bacterium]